MGGRVGAWAGAATSKTSDPSVAFRWEVTRGDPDIAIGVNQEALPQAVRLVGGGLQDLMAEGAGLGLGGVRVVTIEPKLHAHPAQGAVACVAQQGIAVIGVVTMEHPLLAAVGQHREVRIAVDHRDAEHIL